MKTKEEILNSDYMTAKDLKVIIPTLGINKCQNYINEIRDEMRDKNLWVPQSKPYLALTKLVRKKFGF